MNRVEQRKGDHRGRSWGLSYSLLAACGAAVIGASVLAQSGTAQPAKVAPASASPATPTGTGDPHDSQSHDGLLQQGKPVVLGPDVPGLIFDKIVHDFGNISSDEQVFCRFPFKNNSDKVITITEMKASCGCTKPTVKKNDVGPGETDELEVGFSPRGNGHQVKTIRVTTTDPRRPEIVLSIAANVMAVVDFQPKTVIFGDVFRGTARTQRLTLRARDPEMTIDSIALIRGEADPAAPEAKEARLDFLAASIIEMSKEDREAAKQVGNLAPEPNPNDVFDPRVMPGIGLVELSLLPDAPVGPIAATLKVTMTAHDGQGGDRVKRTVDIPVRATIIGDIKVQPPYLNVRPVNPGQDIEGSVFVATASNTTFEISDLEFTPTGEPADFKVKDIKLRAEPYQQDGMNGYRIIMTGNSGDHVGLFRGTIKFRTTLPGEAEQALPFSGIVKKVVAPRTPANAKPAGGK